MEEYSRIVINEYCRTHRNTKKSAFLWDLVELSYTMECEPCIFRAIRPAVTVKLTTQYDEIDHLKRPN